MKTDFNNFSHHAFDSMGTRVNLWVHRSAGHRAAVAFRTGETLIRDFDRRLSRFRPDSELCALNANPAESVEVSPLMMRLVEAALQAATSSGGLVDPTLLDAVERAGYRESRAGVAPASLGDALQDARLVRPARPDPAGRWLEISIDRARRIVTRPAGLEIDSGGCGKGLAADLVAALWRRLLRTGTPFIVDCGGDMRVGDLPDGEPPYRIKVETSPALPEPVELELRSGGVATSGIGSRLWRTDGLHAHHLIDPATGEPAWTGVASATALGVSALAAETAAKTALLGGPIAAREQLALLGGLIVEFDGAVTILDSIPIAQVA